MKKKVFIYYNSYIDKKNLGNLQKNDDKLISVIKMNKLSLDENVLTKPCETIKGKLKIKTTATFHQFSKLFNLQSLHDATLGCIKRYFTMIIKTPSFLELDRTLVSKILSCSGLLISSELEVLNAGNLWLNYKSEERKMFAKDVLLNVRFPLLSDETVRCYKMLLNASSTFSKSEECIKLLNEVLNCKESLYRNKSSIYYTNRYCDHQLFNIVVCGGYDMISRETVGNATHLRATKINTGKPLPSTLVERIFPYVICLKGRIYVFGGLDSIHFNSIMSVEKYSPSTGSWKKVADMFDDRRIFCGSAFMDKIFIIGGYSKANESTTDSCLQFDAKGWKEVARMNQVRVSAACAVYDGKIVVSGGRNGNYTNPSFNTVESYDVLPDRWSAMPSMVSGKSNHGLVVVKNKLFAMGARSETCEVYDNICKKFVVFESPRVKLQSYYVSIGSKIFAFQNKQPVAICYDVDKNKWSEEKCEVTNNLINFSCVKVPWF